MTGVLWWIFYWQLYHERKCPSARSTICWISAFVFWFLAPTRLGGYPHIQEALYQGEAELHAAALRGVASLSPPHYYFIRITTLTFFWIFAGYHYHGFFLIVWKSLQGE